MKKNLFLTTILMCFAFMSLSQSLPLSDTPRLVVYGDASVKTTPDLIQCWLNIYETSTDYDYTQPYDDTKLKKSQQNFIERTGLTQYLTNPKAANFKSYTGTGPYELTFTSREQFEAAQKKIDANYSETLSVSLEVFKTEISAEKNKQLYNQTLEQAIQDAIAKAQKISGSLKVNLGKPVFIEEVSIPMPATYSNDYIYGYDYSGYNTNLEISVSSRVQLQYLIPQQ